MLLLHASTACIPEFASLSLVLPPPPQPSADADGLASSSSSVVCMSEPLLVSSPLAVLSFSRALDALKELHAYVASTVRGAKMLKDDAAAAQEDRVALELLKEDEQQLEEMQIFRPLVAAGVGLHFRFIRGDKNMIAKFSTIILANNKSNNNNKGTAAAAAAAAGIHADSNVLGVLIVVGVSGFPIATLSSPLQYQMNERLNDCREIISKMSDPAVPAVKTLLSTFLLTEDDLRVSDFVANAANLTTIPEVDESTENSNKGAKGVLRMKRHLANKHGANGGVDSHLQDNDDAVITLGMLSSDSSRIMTERLKILSVAENDTCLAKFSTKGTERKANIDLSGGNTKAARFIGRKSRGGKDPDFENFDYKGPKKETAVKIKQVRAMPMSDLDSKIGGMGASSGGSVSGSGSVSVSSGTPRQQKSLSLRQPKKDTSTKGKSPGLPGRRASTVRGGGGSTGGGGDNGQQLQNGFDPFASRGPTSSSTSRAGGRGGTSHTFDDDGDTVASQSRLQVNIALNEDLSCSYRNSQLSSCNVEGVVQVQVKSSAGASANAGPTPFFLLMRDVSQQVESFRENKKFADDVSDALLAEEDADRKFTVSVPKGDSYFPVVRYKCSEDLRPVPIRVQTRVKVDRAYCRVALQISSNPNNEAKLADLTIIMGVPEDVLGESLATQPAGGVWNASKRCVTWCVEELGEGEKFQLQARFQIQDNAPYDANGDKPSFPVLVRCQCLFAQLSDIELVIRDIPEVYPADVTMKIARRFRLSHRERS